ncbi:MAG TPA: nucleoside-diphosphate sugar epimerase/dehydratase [Oscillospiraceae bacterium]|nr:nucleoside-diphosphate sugar epimerase/dehydratase [Oscillospiraceae bacterium]
MKRKGFIKNGLALLLYITDMAALIFSVAIAYLFKFETISGLLLQPGRKYVYFLILDIIATTVCFSIFHIYDRLWKYPNINDYEDLFLGFLISKLISNLALYNNWDTGFLTWFLAYVIISGTSIITIRLMLRWGYNFWKARKEVDHEVKLPGKIRVMIIGAGEAGRMILSEFSGSKFQHTHTVVAIIDDDRNMRGKYLKGIKIYGGREKIIEVAHELKVDEIYLTMPSASAKTVKEILDICKNTDCKLKKLPGMYQFISGQLTATQLKDVDYVDLLGREPINVDLTDVFKSLRDKTILITGGGGSIGGELCRQIAASRAVRRLVIFDVAENGAYNIQQELKGRYPDVEVITLIGTVRDECRLDEVFKEYRPDVIYHAAAHKHVPLMETSPKEAIKNNVFGTLRLAKAADKYGATCFVMISTDKAVNPTNVMGASKRVCEMIVQAFNKTSKTNFVAVRFGNVLGSNGSVIPLFKEQIKNGGPVTVTHPDIIRYFMLIPEAVALVLKAGCTAKGGEIFVLDMGTPVKIAELAENMIKLSGYKPNVDIEVKFTGLREGEKLYEELLIDDEGITKTEDELIYIAKPLDIDNVGLFTKLAELEDNIEDLSKFDIIDRITDFVTTYHANNSEYSKHKQGVGAID